jgi:hypothetical protein
MKSTVSVRLTILLFFCMPILSCQQLDESRLPQLPAFQMSNNMMGTILQSSDREEIGHKVSFIGLNTNEPKVLYESGVTSPLQRIYESDRTLTLQIVASGTGSVDTFVIEKKTGKFARAAAGSLAGVYASAGLGTLK